MLLDVEQLSSQLFHTFFLDDKIDNVFDCRRKFICFDVVVDLEDFTIIDYSWSYGFYLINLLQHIVIIVIIVILVNFG